MGLAPVKVVETMQSCAYLLFTDMSISFLLLNGLQGIVVLSGQYKVSIVGGVLEIIKALGEILEAVRLAFCKCDTVK